MVENGGDDEICWGGLYNVYIYVFIESQKARGCVYRTLEYIIQATYPIEMYIYRELCVLAFYVKIYKKKKNRNKL